MGHGCIPTSVWQNTCFSIRMVLSIAKVYVSTDGIQAAMVSATLLVCVSLVSILQAGYLAWVSTSGRHYFCTYITNTDRHYDCVQ